MESLTSCMYDSPNNDDVGDDVSLCGNNIAQYPHLAQCSRLGPAQIRHFRQSVPTSIHLNYCNGKIFRSTLGYLHFLVFLALVVIRPCLHFTILRPSRCSSAPFVEPWPVYSNYQYNTNTGAFHSGTLFHNTNWSTFDDGSSTTFISICLPSSHWGPTHTTIQGERCTQTNTHAHNNTSAEQPEGATLILQQRAVLG